MSTHQLPHLISAFVRANNEHNCDAILACFSKDALVQDEGNDIQGIDAIQKWLKESIENYQFTLEVLHLSENENETVLTAQVSGTFDGSPIPLDYHFTIHDEKIVRLSIRLMGA